MSTTSIAVERNKLGEHVSVEKPKVVKVRQKSVNRNKFNLLIQSIYSDILDTAKSIIIIFAVLAICKYTGLYAWWMQLISNI